MTTRGFGLSVLERSVLVFLPDVSFHARVGLVDIGRDGRLNILGVEDFVHDVIAMRFHVLYRSSRLAFAPCAVIDRFTHINLIRGPTVHSQRLNLGDMGAQLAMQRGAPHTQEDSHLLPSHQYLCLSR